MWPRTNLNAENNQTGKRTDTQTDGRTDWHHQSISRNCFAIRPKIDGPPMQKQNIICCLSYLYKLSNFPNLPCLYSTFPLCPKSPSARGLVACLPVRQLFKSTKHIAFYRFHTVQRLMLSKGAKRTKFYHITVILQYCWDKMIARSGDLYRDDSGIFSLDINCYVITNTSVQNFAIRISSVKTVPKCLRKLKTFRTNLI